MFRYQIAEDDEILYTGSDCWHLASEIFLLHGHPCWLVMGRRDWDGSQLDRPVAYHAFNYDWDRDIYFDILGWARTPRELMSLHSSWYDPDEELTFSYAPVASVLLNASGDPFDSPRQRWRVARATLRRRRDPEFEACRQSP